MSFVRRACRVSLRWVAAALSAAAWPLAGFGALFVLLPAAEFTGEPDGMMRSAWRAAGAAYAPIGRRTVSVERLPWETAWFNPRELLLTRGSDRPVPPPGDRTIDRWEPLPGAKVRRAVNGRAVVDRVRVATPWWLGAIAVGAVPAGLIGRRLRRRRDDRTDDGVPRAPSPRDRAVRAARPWVWGLAGVGAVALLGGTGSYYLKGTFLAEVRRDDAVPWLPRTLWVAVELDDPAVDDGNPFRAAFGPERHRPPTGETLLGSRRWGVQVDRCHVTPPVGNGRRDEPYWGRRRWAAAANLSWVVLLAAAWSAASLRRSGRPAPVR